MWGKDICFWFGALQGQKWQPWKFDNGISLDELHYDDAGWWDYSCMFSILTIISRTVAFSDNKAAEG